MSNVQQLPIGVFDSGVGGLSVLKVLQEQFPNEDFIYIGDNANNPVGNRSDDEIICASYWCITRCKNSY